ncbi:hypothetical protein HK099_006026 [Clydaea vesicula]|uniref:Pentatricopeptide repeat-containing protein n=1 Tax=Clydaea vesicula TaxID=447962 RepID=A0AAD5XZD6_9FUNG|nr:hypothetical protein HK099_006026 [Clydaea vesicula]
MHLTVSRINFLIHWVQNVGLISKKNSFCQFSNCRSQEKNNVSQKERNFLKKKHILSRSKKKNKFNKHIANAKDPPKNHHKVSETLENSDVPVKIDFFENVTNKHYGKKNEKIERNLRDLNDTIIEEIASEGTLNLNKYVQCAYKIEKGGVIRKGNINRDINKIAKKDVDTSCFRNYSKFDTNRAQKVNLINRVSGVLDRNFHTKLLMKPDTAEKKFREDKCSMLQAYLQQDNPDITKITTYFEEAIKFFGSFNPSTIALYLKFLCKLNLEKELITAFSNLRAPNLIHYTIILQYFSNKSKKAVFFYFFKKLHKTGWSCNVAIYNALIGLQESISAMDFYFNELKSNGFAPNLTTYNLLLKSASSLGMMNKCADYYEEMMKNDITPDIKSYTFLIICCMKSINHEKMEFFYQKMKTSLVKPDAVFFTYLFNSIPLSRKYHRIEFYLNEMESSNVIPNVDTCNSVVHAYISANDIRNAESYLLKMKSQNIKPNASIYNLFLNTFSDDENYYKFKYYYKEMIQNGVSPNVSTYNILLKTLFENDGQKLLDIYRSLLSSGLSPDVVTFNFIIKYFASNEHHKATDFFFNQMLSEGVLPTARTYNILISSAVKHDFFKANQILNEMVAAGIKPDIITYNTIYLSDFTISESEFLRRLNLLSRLEIAPSITTFTSIMQFYSLSRNYLLALQIFHSVTGLRKNFNYVKFPLKLQEIELEDTKHSRIFFSVALDVCKLGNFKKDLFIVWNMALSSGVNLDSNVLTSYVEALCVFKEFNSAIKIVEESLCSTNIPKADKKTLEHLIMGLKDNGGLMEYNIAKFTLLKLKMILKE